MEESKHHRLERTNFTIMMMIRVVRGFSPRVSFHGKINRLWLTWLVAAAHLFADEMESTRSVLYLGFISLD